MESKKDLIKIGQEGFALLDEYYGRKSRVSAPPNPPTPIFSFPSQKSQTFLYQFQPQKPNNVYHVNLVSRTEKTIIRKHEAKPDLVKIGLEGFALMDKYYGKKPGPIAPQQPPPVSFQPTAVPGPTRQAYQSQYQPEKPYVGQAKPAYATEKKVYEASKWYGAVLFSNRSK